MLTYCYIDSSTCHSQADIIRQGDIEAEHACVVEELAKDHLTVWRGRGHAADGLNRCYTVGIRNDCAHFTWQASKNSVKGKNVGTPRIIMT